MTVGSLHQARRSSAALGVPIARTLPIAGRLLVAGTLLAGCGSASPPARPATAPPVHLFVTGPSDDLATLAGDVVVSGTVAPASATVLVEGRQVPVTQGGFRTSVSISPGENVIDVLAAAPHAAGAVAAVRVYRQTAVAVPDLTGVSPSSASARLRAVGLTAKVNDTGGFWQALIPASTQVCQTAPPAGRRVAPGSEVQVQVAKLC
ncbi:MAG: PASTA domain-containing protein [Solirubrobacterales bacterium]|nr:PASTA domain-containing protein [Solirubrobacterales bacterium]